MSASAQATHVTRRFSSTILALAGMVMAASAGGALASTEGDALSKALGLDAGSPFKSGSLSVNSIDISVLGHLELNAFTSEGQESILGVDTLGSIHMPVSFLPDILSGSMKLIPAKGVIKKVGGTKDVQVTIDTGSGQISGGIVAIEFNPQVLEIVDGAEGVEAASGSPFVVAKPSEANPAVPPVLLEHGCLYIQFATPEMDPVAFSL